MRCFYLLGLALSCLSGEALADEILTCHFPYEVKVNGRQTIMFRLHDNKLAELDAPFRNFDLLYSNETGLAAAWGASTPARAIGLPQRSTPSIGVTAFAMDRKTGRAVESFTTIYDSTPPPQHGLCKASGEVSSPPASER